MSYSFCNLCSSSPHFFLPLSNVDCVLSSIFLCRSSIFEVKKKKAACECVFFRETDGYCCFIKLNIPIGTERKSIDRVNRGRNPLGNYQQFTTLFLLVPIVEQLRRKQDGILLRIYILATCRIVSHKRNWCLFSSQWLIIKYSPKCCQFIPKFTISAAIIIGKGGIINCCWW